jgi:DNA replication protein DnaD
MRNFSDEEYLKVFRKMVFWEWYTDVNTTKLFLHCLLMANWKPGRWRGISYKRGQFFTSIGNLAKETGLSVREVRTALEHLESTNEVTSKTTNRYTLITVVSFDKYQGERQAERQTNDTQNDTQNDKQATNKRQQNKNNKNNKKKKEEYTAPPESEQSENYEDYEDDEEGFIIPQKDEHGNWINIPEEWKKVGGVVQIRC